MRRLTLWMMIVAWLTPLTARAGTLSLADAYRLGLRNQTTLRLMREEVKRAEINKRRALALLLPTLDASMTYTRFKQAQTFDPSLFAPPGVNLGLGTITIQPLDLFTINANLKYRFELRSIPLYKNVKTAVKLQTQRLSEERQGVLLAVASLYYQALLMREAVELQKRRIRYATELLEMADVRYKAGVGSKTEVIRSQIEVEKGKRDLLTAGSALTLAKHNLAITIRGPAQFDLVAPAPVKQPTFNYKTTSEWLRAAWRTRPGLRAAHYNIEIQKRSIRETWYKFVPSLSLSFMPKWSNSETGFGGSQFDWTFVATLSFPLFDGGLRYAELRERRSLLSDAEIQLDAQKALIASQIADAHKQYRDARIALASSKKILALAQENLRLARAGYKLGSVVHTVVLDGVNALAMAEVNLARDRLRREIAILLLRRAMGVFKPL